MIGTSTGTGGGTAQITVRRPAALARYIVSDRVRLDDEGVPVGIYHLSRNTVILR